MEKQLLEQVSSILAGLQSEYTLEITSEVQHPSRRELIDLLSDVASCSAKISLRITDGTGFGFRILKDGNPASVSFQAIPTGHEFSTLLLLILNLDGKGKNLPDEQIRQRLRSIRQELVFQSFISLSCTNCPDVVQALNVFSVINPLIRHEILDGSLFPDEVKRLNIQAVPSVFLNGELFHVGRASLGELLIRLEENLYQETQPEPLEQQEQIFDVLIAGGGPAGVSAAVYSARKGLNVALVAEQLGGQLNETLGIENMISIPSTTGKILASGLKSHLDAYPVRIFENRRIVSALQENGLTKIRTSLGETFVAPAFIIATGASWRRLNIEGEAKYIGSGVAFCAHCDGPFYKGKKVAVIGGGNSGLEAAIDLSNIASEVTLLEYLPELKGDQILQEKIKNLPNVRVITHAESLRIEGDGTKVTGLVYRERETGKEEPLAVDGIFVQIGLKPNSDIVKDLVQLSPYGEIIIDAHGRTSRQGIYAAGDVTTVPFKQIVIAMGEGSKAALSAFEDRIKGVIQTA